MLKIGHEVVRPGKFIGDDPVTIRVPEELETAPGIPLNDREVDWYAREYPLESQNRSERASHEWNIAIREQYVQLHEIRKEHDKLNHTLIVASRESAELEPTGETTGEDVTEVIKDRARKLGFLEVGYTAYDPRYEYKHKRGVTDLPTAICLVSEQDFESTQTIPSVDAEIVHHSIYRTATAAALKLGDFIRSLGYRAHIIPDNDTSGPVIPMFVQAGLGQLGACGYLLTTHEGSRNRLMIITTDAEVTHDEPIDYGIHAFCQIWQAKPFNTDRPPGEPASIHRRPASTIVGPPGLHLCPFRRYYENAANPRGTNSSFLRKQEGGFTFQVQHLV